MANVHFLEVQKRLNGAKKLRRQQSIKRSVEGIETKGKGVGWWEERREGRETPTHGDHSLRHQEMKCKKNKIYGCLEKFIKG